MLWLFLQSVRRARLARAVARQHSRVLVFQENESFVDCRAVRLLLKSYAMSTGIRQMGRRLKHRVSAVISAEVTFLQDALNRPYLEHLEEKLCELAANYKQVDTGVSSAAELKDGSWTEVYPLRVGPVDLMDSIADEVVAIIRELGIPKGHIVHLTKRLLDEQEGELFRKRVYKNRETKWHAAETVGFSQTAKEKPPAVGPLPGRIDYLRKEVARYYLAGGEDFSAVFRKQSDLDTFLEGLSSKEKIELQVAYDQIVANADHEWVMQWLMEDCDGYVSTEKHQVLYFLACLDRFLQAELLNGDEELVDWDLLATG